MTKITKVVAGALVLGVASSAAAHEVGPKVTLTGGLDTQFGYRSEKSYFDATALGGAERLQKFAIVNDTHVKVKVDGQGKGFKYGGLINLNADTSESKYMDTSVARQTMMYVESNMGRFEAGSYTGAYEAMRTNAGRLARATGGIDGDTRYWVNQTMVSKFIFTPALPTAYKEMDSVANAAKVSYYTPSFGGFKAGVTFIPDSEQHGTVTLTRTVARNFADALNDSKLSGYKNVLQGGVMYNGKMDKVGLKVAALGEFGDAKKDDAGGGTVWDRHDLRAFEVGATVTYMGFGLGGSYGDWGKSGLYKSSTTAGVTTATTGKKSSNFWSVGANYVYNNWGVSLTYLSSKSGGMGLSGTDYSTQKGNADVVSFGLDYKVAPGFMPYAEVTHFNMKDKSVAAGSAARKDSGTVVLAGSKLSF